MPEQLGYLSALLLSITGLAVLDWRFRLAFFHDYMRATKTLASGMAVFIIWDIIGIGAGIFKLGNSPYLSGINLGPELPLEEIFFLFVLTYSALLLWRGGEKRWPTI